MTKNITGKIIASAIAAIALAACTTVSSETRIPTGVSASEYNSVASRYMERPTFASIQSMSDGEEVLRLEMDTYGSGVNPAIGIAIPFSVPFDKRFGAEYLALIDKFFEWEGIARERGDLIDREIGTAPTWSNMGGTGTLKFSIYSSNLQDQMLIVNYCLSVSCSDQYFTFSRANARELGRLLADFTEGRIGQANLDGVYQ